jgi:hypothetical protein
MPDYPPGISSYGRGPQRGTEYGFERRGGAVVQTRRPDPLRATAVSQRFLSQVYWLAAVLLILGLANAGRRRGVSNQTEGFFGTHSPCVKNATSRQ